MTEAYLEYCETCERAIEQFRLNGYDGTAAALEKIFAEELIALAAYRAETERKAA